MADDNGYQAEPLDPSKAYIVGEAADGFITPMGWAALGAKRVPVTEFDRPTREALTKRLDEFDRVRNQGAVDARHHPLH